MNHARFYLKHALNNMWRNRQRTLFVLFCIGAGVAAIVSLRTLGLMIGDALTSNLQEELRADITVQANSAFGANAREVRVDPELVIEGGQFQSPSFSEVGLERMLQWAAERGYTAAPERREATPLQARSSDDPQNVETVSLFFIDGQQYPLYGDTPLLAPADGELADLLREVGDVVVTEKLADALALSLGDTIRVTGIAEPFTVRGIVADTAEASLTDPTTLFFPFIYLPFETAQQFGRTATQIYFKLPSGSDVVAAEAAFLESFPGLRTRTTEDVRETNELVSDRLTELITTMGLISLLIGGIGIINTMQVVVRRRALEIGVLKTLGLQGRHITQMFMLEALLLGFSGSLVGIVLGLGLTRLLQGIGENLTSRSLQLAIYPEAVLLGLITGTVVTLVFGFLPTLAAGRVRPNIVLSPTQGSPIPPAARLQTLIVVALLTLLLGLLVGQIIGDFVLGIGATVAVFAVVGLAALLMWAVTYIVTILPTFGRLRLRLAQRAISTHRGRAANTLLALSIGMFALSFIVLFTQSIISLINISFEQQLGGNILAFGQTSAATAELQTVAAGLPAVDAIEHQELYLGEVVAINGDRDMQALFDRARDVALRQRAAELEELDPDARENRLRNARTQINFDLLALSEQLFLQTPNERMIYELKAGQDFAPGQEKAILLPGFLAAIEWLELAPGDTLTFRFEGGAEVSVTIAGILEEFSPLLLLRADEDAELPGGAVVTADTIPDATALAPMPVIINAKAEQLDATVERLAQIPNVFVFETSLIQSFIVGILEQLTALPLAVAFLALFASGVIIANTVSLATLERRREIGIMKAIGLQSNQVLSLLLLENGLLGLIGGILGCSIGSAVALFTVLSDTTGTANFPLATLLWLLLLAVGLSLIATLFTAVGAARAKPLEVLRSD